MDNKQVTSSGDGCAILCVMMYVNFFIRGDDKSFFETKE